MMLAALPATGSTLLYAQGTDPTPTYDPGIMIGGNVYGGGSEGAVGSGGSETKVRILGGTIEGSVFGGGEKADVNGGTHVQLDGAYATGDIIIGNVYGGNDIAGVVSGAAHVESTYGADHTIKVTNLFGGGNGDYDYTSNKNEAGDETNPNAGLLSPEIAETQIDLKAGFFDQVFGGGNKATVSVKTTITLDNSTQLLSTDKATGILAGCDKFQFGRVFGGNNLVDMAIRPTWDLQKGIVNNLYSGGNKGGMTYENGILIAVTKPDMVVENVYGGCRMADVKPMKDGAEVASIAEETIKDKDGNDIYKFPEGYAARVYISDGQIKNVYGGNDISGDVHFGTNVEIHGTVIGDVYGGGNGSYAYTDKKTDSEYYYAPGESSVTALNIFRPNTENVLLHVAGTEASPTYVGGSVYCGGNSATLRSLGGDLGAAQAKFQIGSYAVMDKVFLGSNGENMVNLDIINKYADNDYSSLDLKDETTFDEYMKGVEVGILPDVSFDAGYEGYSTKIGSLYGGGNVGSMSASGMFTLNFLNSVVIYNKVVGGCNNANVHVVADPTAETPTYITAEHKGGIITGDPDATKITLNISGMKLEPRILNLSYNTTAKKFEATWEWSKDAGNRLLYGNIYGGCYQSGYVNGGVEINITQNVLSEEIANANINTDLNRDYVFSTALSAFGGGYGQDTEILGNTNINISGEGNILKAFGGGEMGVVDKDATINITGGNAGKLYGGGFEGLVKGNTTVYLDGGEIYDAIAGACNADINGSAKMLLGENGGATHVLHNVYGGNDFGGQIKTAQTNTATVGTETKSVYSNTYVKYLLGKVEGNVFGGACGDYDYTTDPYKTKAQAEGFSYPKFTETLTGGAINSNSFVDIASTSTSDDDVVNGGVFGGGRGHLDATGIVDMNNTYVLLHSSNSRNKLVENVFGGGYYSNVTTTLVDAYTGNYATIYGGTFGASASTDDAVHLTNANYSCGTTNVNTYPTLTRNPELIIFGAGSYAGATTTNVNLYGGNAAYVYGGSYKQGYCGTTNVNVPEGSTVAVTGLYGGSFGENSGFPCDVLNSKVTFASETAYVSDAIFGGNRSERATQNALINISTPVLQSEGSTFYTTIYGGGDGASTITGTTKVNLLEGAKVETVFGGGRNGKVYNQYDLRDATVQDYYPSKSEYTHWTGESDNLNIESGSFELTYTDGEDKGKWYTEDVKGLAYINIAKGANVTGNIYGGGYGEDAVVAGTAYVKLDGGTVEGNIYGGGYAGPVRSLVTGDFGISGKPADQTPIGTYCQIVGGKVNNVYGGGLKGNVGTITEHNLADMTMVEIGVDGVNNFYTGNPTILRSVYGGGEQAAVYGTSRVKMANGYVGYKYSDGKYVENVDLKSKDDNLLLENGNLYGAGYGEGATVDKSEVYLYDGTIRNGLYGGGEIASVGIGTTKLVDGQRLLDNITHSGETHIYMYGGNVIGDVFGGGRGFSYDLTGNEVTGKQFYTDGYVFGTTDVNIFRGAVGTLANYKDGHGNVFGGGNIGYIYNAKQSKKDTDGRYYKIDKSGNYIKADGEKLLSEDCRVIVSAYAKVTASVTINGKTYNKGDYVPTEVLNSASGNSVWSSVDDLGITIENAVFAGGNVSSGSDKIYANAKTIYGNATASVIDLYAKDYVLVSNEGVGGLYGDGNLTFVDGYRELNISNYGTDYYTLNQQLTIDQYNELNRREKSYYELKYKCNNTYYSNYFHGQMIANSTISAIEYGALPEEEREKGKWTSAGFCTLYAGRMMNTIQRTDFCGVFGSRIVLNGARDRVPEVVDYTNYTINRVGEVSLNQVQEHGNYFGIYNVVNLLGAITSDVDFSSERKTTSYSFPADPEATTYEAYKVKYLDEANRNNGDSKNKIALASGVFLEIVKDYDDNNKKIYGPITGIIELDLINVKTGEGGGYVYAENIHGTRGETNLKHVTLAGANANAVTYNKYEYTGDNEYETSGNFVHSAKRIVDDCYPQAHDHDDKAGQGHYWYIKGDYYVYNQYISAYTGATNSYTTTFDVPMIINPQSDGEMRLTSVEPNLYAYFVGKSHTNSKTHTTYESLTANDKIFIESTMKEYALNDPISKWDYDHLTAAEKEYFIPTTYVAITDAKIGDVTYHKGDVIDGTTFTALASSAIDLNAEDDASKNVTKDYVFRLSNNLSNAKGFLLTLDYNNPEKWDDYYTLKDTPVSKTNKSIDTKTYNDASNQSSYIEGPSLLCQTAGIYGQKSYEVGTVISESVYDQQQAVITGHNDAYQALLNAGITQASFQPTYIADEPVEYTLDGNTHHILRGGYISQTEYGNITDATAKDKFSEAYICTQTFSPADGVYVVYGEKISAKDLTFTLTDNKVTITKITINGIDYSGNFTDNFNKAYYCTTAGKFGGTYFEESKNYTALEYCELDAQERETNFTYNYDGFDALRADFDNDLSLYSHPDDDIRAIDYADAQPVDYTAQLKPGATVTYNKKDGSTKTITSADILSREDYESIPNEKYYWRAIDYKRKVTYTVNETFTVGTGADAKNYAAGEVLSEEDYVAVKNAGYDTKINKVTSDNGPTYVIKDDIVIGEKQYTCGKTITAEEYNSLTDAQKTQFVDILNFTTEGRYYYCVKEYVMGEKGGYADNTQKLNVLVPTDNTYNINNLTQKAINDGITVGTVILGGGFTDIVGTYGGTNPDDYNAIPNYQNGFQLLGDSPIEISTLYVPRQSEIQDYQQDRIVTVIYTYKYTEVYDNGHNMETQLERHIINIHVHFEDGIPEIGAINPPAVVLPKSTIGIHEPVVIPGAYEILGGGWEIFENETDAKYHRNGEPYLNDATPMYWYNDGYQVAYYAKTYAGKTYSNPVRISVANYHHLDEVMNDPDYLHIDTARVQRACKIYIDDRECQTSATKSELDLLKDLYDLSEGGFAQGDKRRDFNYDHHITGLQNLDFILQSDVAPKAYTDWTPIGVEGKCFSGTIHGQGHTVSGLNNSLLGYACGAKVYNLGVTGSFTGGGVADNDAYAENCWVWTTGTADNTKFAIVGNGGGGNKMVNCYYPETNAYYNTTTSGVTLATARPVKDFINGNVAYDLNRYYLEKRYQDQTLHRGDAAVIGYKFMEDNGADTLAVVYQKAEYDEDGNETKSEAYTHFYNTDYATFRPWDANIGGASYDGKRNMGYVEYFYHDGDYRYAKGTIPTATDERHNAFESGFYPIWPDDYVIFGQNLYFDTDASKHESHPGAANREAKAKYETTYDTYENLLGRLSKGDKSNRVYRAPGYYLSKTMGDPVFFNQHLALDDAFTYNEVSYDIYHNLTAVDFTGHGDSKEYKGKSEKYAPILDYAGINSVKGVLDLTQNLLIYAPDATVDAKSYSALTDYFAEPTLTIGTDYSEIPVVTNTNSVKGHVVSFIKSNTEDASDKAQYFAKTNQFFVDKQNFNAPIAYTFTEGNHAWYQRTPNNETKGGKYANGSEGWETICLPFTADLVTTQTKGEITHFYGSASDAQNYGHEYWLREFSKVSDGTEANTVKAEFARPGIGSKEIEVGNKFLYDYYYSKSEFNDDNEDKYQKTYYNAAREYNNYPFFTAETPYLIGFPNDTYYEFDLSGTFVPENTASTIVALPAQVISFVSGTRGGDTAIEVSDDMIQEDKRYQTVDGYVFSGYFDDEEIPVGDYVLDAEGAGFDKISTAEKAEPFRAYFNNAKSSGAKDTRRLIIGQDKDSKGEFDASNNADLDHTIKIYVQDRQLVVESSYETDLNVYYVSGQFIKRIHVEAGTNTYEGFRPGFYVVGRQKVHFKPGNY